MKDAMNIKEKSPTTIDKVKNMTEEISIDDVKRLLNECKQDCNQRHSLLITEAEYQLSASSSAIAAKCIALDEELRVLKIKSSAQASLIKSMDESEPTYKRERFKLQEQLRMLQEKSNTVDSERAMNADLTAEVEQLRAENERLRGKTQVRPISEADKSEKVFGFIEYMPGKFGEGFVAEYCDDLNRWQCEFQTEIKAHIPTHFIPLPEAVPQPPINDKRGE